MITRTKRGAIAVRPEGLGELGGGRIDELIVFGRLLDVEDVARLPLARSLTARLASREGWDALLAAPIAQSLDALVVPSKGAVGELRDRLPRCRRVALPAADELYPAYSIEPLAKWQHIGELHELDLSNADADGQELAALLAAARELVVLRVSGNPAARFSAETLVQLTKLARLEVIQCELTADELAAMRAARPDVTIVAALSPGPCAIDVIGHALELRPIDGAWGVWVDGVRRRVRAHDMGYVPGFPPWSSASDCETAPLESVAEALALGWPIELTDRGFVLDAALLPRTRDLHVELSIPADESAPVDVTIELAID